nr:hypothetical protein [Tanacetum cinerariifolium]
MKSKDSRDDYLQCANHTAKLVREQWVDTVNHEGKWTNVEEEGDSNEVQVVYFYPRTESIEPLEWKALKNWLKPSSVEPPKLELKELPEHLEYAFLQESNQLPLGNCLENCGKKGIDSSFCTHKILMEDEFKRSVQPQIRVKQNIKEVVKKEVIRLFDAGLIYPIFDSPWVIPIQAPIMIKPDWSLRFEFMCVASDYGVGAVLGKMIDKHFKTIHYTSKTMNEAQENYLTTEKELLVVVFAFDRQYLVLSKTIVFVDHSTLRVEVTTARRLRIEQYFQVQDYALWDVIENGNSFKPVAQTTTNDDGTSTTLLPCPVTTEEKAQKKNAVKARKTRFGGNEATKKTQNTILKQLYENFSAKSKENKSDLDTMSIHDLYNNFNIVEQEVKGTACSDSSSQNIDFMTSPTTNSTNEVSTAYGVSTASTQSSTVSTKVSTASLSDATVYAFLSNQLNGSQLIHEDLEQIHEDDLEEMYLKWQLELLSMRTKRFFQKTKRKITINRSDTTGFDKSKVECYNCHKMEHFSKECRQPRNQDSRSWNQDSSRRTVNVEETPPKAMVSIDRVGSQITDISRKGVGSKCYNVVPPPPIGLFSPSKIDLFYSGLEEFQQSKFESYGPKSCRIESKNASNIIPNKLKESTEVKEYSDVSLVKKLASNDKLTAITVKGKGWYQGIIIQGITGKGTIHTGILDFKNVYFVKELKFNLFSVSQMCDKKNNVLFTDTECIVLTPNFKLPDENQILLRVPKRKNMYSVDMKNIVPKEILTCLIVKAILDESML